MRAEREKQIVENNYVSMKKIKGQDEDWIYTIRHGAVTVQINKEKAEFICRMLADWLGFSVEKKEIVKILKDKANTKTTKQYPIGA